MTPPDIPLLGGPFYFLRHGESTANRDRVMAGTIDVPLTDAGRAQAEALADRLAGLALGSIYSSELARAVDTVLPLAARQGLPVRRLAGLGERHWGTLENRPLADRTGGPQQEVPGAEPWPDFVARVWAALAAVDGPPPVLIVAHSGTLRALRQGLGIDDESKAANAEPLRLVPGGAGWTVQRL